MSCCQLTVSSLTTSSIWVLMYVCIYYPCPLAGDKANNYVLCVRHGMCIASYIPMLPDLFSTLNSKNYEWVGNKAS